MFAPKAPEAIYSAIRLIVSALLRGTSLTAGPLIDSEPSRNGHTTSRPRNIEASLAGHHHRAWVIAHKEKEEGFLPPRLSSEPQTSPTGQ